LGVTGPSLATSVLLAGVAATHGVGALVLVTCATGALQVLSGVFQLGGLVRFVPQPVIAGFTAGVGGVMLFGQLPRIFGISGPEAPGVVEMVNHCMAQMGNIHPASIFLSLGTLATTLLLPKVFPKVPASVVGVAAAAALNVFLGLGAPVIGEIPCSFPMPSLPQIPDFDTMSALMGSSLALYGLTSLESLLSGSAADKIDKEDPRKHNPNVDLVGQGLSNLAVSCFGGIPVTGAIARTSLNITAGAKTRRAAIVHVGVLGAVFALGPVVSMIPLSALSGVLLSVAIRLLNPKELKFLSKVSHREVIPLAATFCTVLASDLVTGVEVGVMTAMGMQLTRKLPRLLAFTSSEGSFNLRGDITFLSASRIGKLQKELVAMNVSEENPVVVDFSGVRSVDASASEMVVDIIYDMEDLGHTPETFQIVGMSSEHQRVMELCDSRGLIAKFIR
jgi:carbonic anhydrase